MKGYKASYNGRCNNFLYEVGKIYEFDGKPLCCQQGFHFCQYPDDVFWYYPYQPNEFVLFEVESHGEVDNLWDKACTNKIEIKRIVPKEEYARIFKKTLFRFDEKWNCVYISSGIGECCTYTYKENSIEVTDLFGGNSIREYDEWGNCIKITYLGEKSCELKDIHCEFKYDDNRNCIWKKYANGDEYELKNGEWIKIEKE
jgi:hypothetical protein